MPAGTATTCAGKGGEGKTTLVISVAAKLTRGTLEGDYYGKPSAVIIVGPEDDWGPVMVPRFIAAGADLDKVFQVAIRTVSENWEGERELRFPVDTLMMEQAIQQTGAKMIVLDPAPALMQGDMNKVQDVRQAMGPLIALAQKYDLALVLINHFAKGQSSVSSKLSGSHAWRDAVRSFLAFAKDEDSGERVMTVDKNNYATDLGSYSFEIVSEDVETPDGTVSVGRAIFGGPTDTTVGQILARQAVGGDDEGEQEDRNAAQEFVLDFLKGRDDGEAPAGDVIKAGRAAGFSDNDMKNARKRCREPKIASRKAAFGAGWVWAVEDSLEGVTEPPKVSKESKESPPTDMTPSRHLRTVPTQGVTQGVIPANLTPSTPSSDPLTPSTCPLHKEEDVHGCYTCNQIAQRPDLFTA
ncbi:hypothetical protein DWQ67_10135 [Galactobacter caseinivorans]|uniref:AAA family ATPase n=2 Tax=Galactobacter caseinivorans TaxID=2676123 RepID=A0A496PH73_9MICC|nr:hypothetical protein DWQ67_10135 [Galactobacter caseinivorans]